VFQKRRLQQQRRMWRPFQVVLSGWFFWHPARPGRHLARSTAVARCFSWPSSAAPGATGSVPGHPTVGCPCCPGASTGLRAGSGAAPLGTSTRVLPGNTTVAGWRPRHLQQPRWRPVLGSLVSGLHLQHHDAEPTSAEQVALRFRCYLSHGFRLYYSLTCFYAAISCSF
jgi:hypothetical protein